MISIFGLKNCSTCVKAQQWLSTHGLSFTFYDVRQTALSAEQLRQWAEQLGWDRLLNKRSQTWRGLSDEQKSLTDTQDLIKLVQSYPSLMKRPLLVYQQTILLGFNEIEYTQLLKQ
ncbi:Spx/MgsR family RNA polymerase-binding regulatory protein [Pelistega ratti]|uniref:Spx/MgsR family RNA polymerase-binding regulatory protein n=1 Tax=Pelistega ratti TaxID=2652177 RepID=UPI001FA96B4D|nr:Spx/MgsR family RNA polymerase-binding regulatory protein [Pelistega ratti]